MSVRFFEFAKKMKMSNLQEVAPMEYLFQMRLNREYIRKKRIKGEGKSKKDKKEEKEESQFFDFTNSMQFQINQKETEEGVDFE